MTIGIDRDTAQHLAENGLNIRGERESGMTLGQAAHILDLAAHESGGFPGTVECSGHPEDGNSFQQMLDALDHEAQEATDWPEDHTEELREAAAIWRAASQAEQNGAAEELVQAWWDSYAEDRRRRHEREEEASS